MKASELIQALTAKITEDGDLDVLVQVLDCGIYGLPADLETVDLFDVFEGRQWDISPRGDDEAEHRHVIVIAPKEL